ncbi:MAG: membrane-bound lytic murein transglycosylase F [Polaribacter sp.]
MNRYPDRMQNSRLKINILKLPSKVFYQLIRFSAKHLELIVISFLILLAAVQYYVRPQSQSLLEIQSSGVMRVLISDDPDSQYIFNKQHYGFEYEMLSRFADQNDLKLELEIVPFAELFSLLDGGAGDVAVGGILSNNYVKRVGMPTIPWYQAKTTVVYKRGSDKPENLEELSLQGVKASARYYGIEGFDELNLIDDHRSEYELLSAVASGTERFAITTNYRANNAKHYLPNLNRSFILPNRVDLVWVLPRVHDVGLLNLLNEFLQESVADDVPNNLAKSYFALPKKITTYDALSIHKKIDKVLPKFEFAFRKAARRGRIDWPLLAAVSYQESKWSNSARSPTGVRGIMQLTESTARALGVDDRLDMTQSIDAAAAYINQLRARLPKKIKEPERTWFAVGAYNVGYRHVLNAYKKARELGLDRTKWKTISNLLPNLYGAPFAQGVQAQHYVERVQIFTDILRFYDLHQRDEIEFKPVIGVVKDVAVSSE